MPGTALSRSREAKTSCPEQRLHQSPSQGQTKRRSKRRNIISCEAIGRAQPRADVAVLAIDVGTTALKAALVLPSGELPGRVSISYDRGTQTAEGA